MSLCLEEKQRLMPQTGSHNEVIPSGKVTWQWKMDPE